MTILQGFPTYSTALTPNTFAMDALTDFLAWRIRVRDTSPIIKCEVNRNSVSGTPGTLGVVLCADTGAGIPNVNTGVPVDIGGGSPTLLSLAAGSVSNGVNTFTFTNPYTPTAGEYVWLVLYPTAATYDGSNRHVWRSSAQGGIGSDYGDEVSASSTDTGSTWTRTRMAGHCSLLTTADAYIPTFSTCCFENLTLVDWDDADNPDERGNAWTIPANTAASVYGAFMVLRIADLGADFVMACYQDGTSQSSRSVDTSQNEVQTSTNLGSTIAFNSPPVSLTAGTGRVTRRPSIATLTIRDYVYEFGTQARRESCTLFKDFWYCHRDGGAGAFTDDKTRAYGILPIVSYAGTGGGGGGLLRPVSQSGGLV